MSAFFQTLVECEKECTQNIKEKSVIMEEAKELGWEKKTDVQKNEEKAIKQKRKRRIIIREGRDTGANSEKKLYKRRQKKSNNRK